MPETSNLSSTNKMIRYTQLSRVSQRSIASLRPSAVRFQVQRRLESSSAPEEAPNEFIRERRHVKEHADKSAG